MLQPEGGHVERVEREVTVPAEPDEVWRMLTEPDGLAGWLAEEAEIDVRPDGEARFRMADGEERTGFVEEADPPARLTLWWRAGDEDASRIEFTLEPVDDGTRVTVVESRPLRALDLYGAEIVLGGGAAGPQLRATALA
jgi:uncharacterized protein YndB with AHSA1/START domain